jgi:hypothetical protein
LAEFNNSLKSTHCSNSRGMFSASIPTCNDHNGAGDSLLFQIQKPWDKPWSTTYCFFSVKFVFKIGYQKNIFNIFPTTRYFSV